LDYFAVMAGRVPAIHASDVTKHQDVVPATSAGMTIQLVAILL
jgi:hypothetical protein